MDDPVKRSFLFINPKEYKLCADCVGYDVATLDLVNITQGKIGEAWAQLTYNACLTAQDQGSTSERSAGQMWEIGAGTWSRALLTVELCSG